MSERPTPEYDTVPSEFALRERDEARERAAKWESSFDAMERAGAEQARRADKNREWALMAERERDEAIADRDIARLAALDSDKAHDRMVGELENVYNERDEARERLAKITMAAEVVIDRWEQPAWKDTEPTAAVIYRLRDALGREEG